MFINNNYYDPFLYDNGVSCFTSLHWFHSVPHNLEVSKYVVKIMIVNIKSFTTIHTHHIQIHTHTHTL